MAEHLAFDGTQTNKVWCEAIYMARYKAQCGADPTTAVVVQVQILLTPRFTHVS